MPPKKAAGASKAEKKVQEKIIEDKTFGLKNKNKSKKVQQFCKSVKQQVQSAGRRGPPPDVLAEQRKREEKRLKEEKKKEEALVHSSVIVSQPKVPPGVDPKSFVCELWKKGLCTKSAEKCKYAHDYNAGRKAAKIDLYTDQRQVGAAGTMETWGQAELEKVVDEKRGDKNRNIKTNIVCKHFLEALESRKYGWFWVCPNGDDCAYVHALPPGFVLSRKETAAEAAARMEAEEEERDTLEEILERERAKIKDGTPLTKERFLKWKEDKKARDSAAVKKKEDDRKAEIAQGKLVLMSGRELLIYKPQVFVDDESAMEGDELAPMRDEEFDARLNEEEARALKEAGEEEASQWAAEKAAMKAEEEVKKRAEDSSATATTTTTTTTATAAEAEDVAVENPDLFLDDDDDDCDGEEDGGEPVAAAAAPPSEDDDQEGSAQ